jgi:hypothetical protein
MNESEKEMWRKIYDKLMVALVTAKLRDENMLQQLRSREIEAALKLEEMKAQLIETNTMNWVVFLSIQQAHSKFQQLSVDAHMSIQQLEEEIEEVKVRSASL